MAATLGIVGPSGSGKTLLPDDLDQVLTWLSPAALNLVLVECFKGSPHPQIELASNGVSVLGSQHQQEVLARLPPLVSPEQAAVAAERLVGPFSAQLQQRGPSKPQPLSSGGDLCWVVWGP